MKAKSVLPPRWQVPDELSARIGSSAGRQRPMVAKGHLLLVLHAPPTSEDAQRVGRFFWRTPDGNWTSDTLGSGVAALNKQLDEYENLIAALDRQEDVAKTAEEYFAVMEKLTPLHRAARNMYQALHEARKQCPDFRDLIDLRDRAYSIERMADLLTTGTNNALDFVMARRAEQQAKSSERMAAASHRLNVLAAFFFPIITLTAVLEVDFATVAANFGIAPQAAAAQGRIAFVAVIACCLVVGAILTTMISRPPRSR